MLQESKPPAADVKAACQGCLCPSSLLYRPCADNVSLRAPEAGGSEEAKEDARHPGGASAANSSYISSFQVQYAKYQHASSWHRALVASSRAVFQDS